jgi:hypothetical protein
MPPRVILGALAPFLCRNCQRVLWWSVAYGPEVPHLIDARGRRHCTPKLRHRYREHRMPQVERKPR